METPLTILHFNDVYNIEPQKQEPVGGAARMAHYIKSEKDVNPLVLFSGDALNPSLMSIFLKGDQMIPILNALNVQCAVYGNHDFDFGVDHLEDVAEQTNFPWLMSNIIDKLSSAPLANGKTKHMLDWHGTKVGLMGLVEEEWIDTLSTVDPADIIFEDFVEVGNRLAEELKEEGADIIIALTHMRWPNDRKVAEEIPGVDIVLGGHDHDYGVETVNGKYVIKSGTDFRNMSKITIKKASGEGFDIDVEKVDLDSSIPEDKAVKESVTKRLTETDGMMDEHLGNMGVKMDGRFSSVRSQETNLGNFITDIVLEAVPADVCLLNSGTLRSDRVHEAGEFKLRDLLSILPFVDPLCVIEISGKGLIAALENGVSQFPKLEGRFPQISGVRFTFDPSKPVGERVDPDLVTVQEEDVDMEKMYRLCTKEFIASGKDGYVMFGTCPVVVSSEQCPSISTAVRNHFESVQILKHQKQCRSGHRQSLCSIVRRTVLMHKTASKFMSLSPTIKAKDPEGNSIWKMEEIMRNAFRRDSLVGDAAHLEHLAKITPQGAVRESFKETNSSPRKLKKVTNAFVRQVSISEVEDETGHLKPIVDGRILKIDEKARQAMRAQKGLASPAAGDNQKSEENNTEKSAENNTGKSAENNTEKSAENNSETARQAMRAQKGLASPAAGDNQKSAENNTEKSAENNTEKSAENNTGKSAENNTEKSAENNSETVGN